MPKKLKPARTVVQFMQKHGRLPMLTDKTPPWAWRGWILPYIQELQRTRDDIPDRWGYHARTIAGEKFLREPIPRLEFGTSKHTSEVSADLRKWLDSLSHSRGAWDRLRLFIHWLGWGLGTRKDPPKDLSKEDLEKLYKTVNLGPWLVHPYDYLGQLVADGLGGGRWNPMAFFPTPHELCELLVKMNIADQPGKAKAKRCDPRALSVHDPCAGTGRMLLHASNYSMNLSAQDIDGFVLDILKINAALYVPWLLVPLPKAMLECLPGKAPGIRAKRAA